MFDPFKEHKSKSTDPAARLTGITLVNSPRDTIKPYDLSHEPSSSRSEEQQHNSLPALNEYASLSFTDDSPTELPAFSAYILPPAEPQQGNLPESLGFESIRNCINILLRALATSQNKRSRLLRSQLISTQSRISSWAQERDINTLEQLQSMLQFQPNVTIQMVADGCQRVRLWVQSTKSTRSRLEESTKDPLVTLLQLQLECYDALETLKLFCEILYDIIPHLNNRHNFETEDLSLATPIISEGDYEDIAESIQTPPATVDVKPEVTEGRKRLPIEDIFSNCLQALRAATRLLLDKDSPNYLYSRLVVWGGGIFQSTKSLDLILGDESSESLASFRAHIIGILADIAVILVILMRSFDLSLDHELQRALDGLESCFGKYREFNEQSMEDGPDIAELPGSSSGADFQQSCLTQLAGLVDCLFDVLPSIDRLRQIWILDLETRSRELAARMAKTSMIATKAEDNMIESPPGLPSEFSSNLDRMEQVNTEAWEYGEPESSGFPSDKSFFEKGKQVYRQNLGLEEENSGKIAGLKRRAHVKQHTSKVHDETPIQELQGADVKTSIGPSLPLLKTKITKGEKDDEDERLVAQLFEWDKEIERLANWSEALDRSLGSDPSEEKIELLVPIFQQLAKISETFGHLEANTGTIRSEASLGNQMSAQEELASAAYRLSNLDWRSVDIKAGHTQESYNEALETLRGANNSIQLLEKKFPADWKATVSHPSQLQKVVATNPTSRTGIGDDSAPWLKGVLKGFRKGK